MNNLKEGIHVQFADEYEQILELAFNYDDHKTRGEGLAERWEGWQNLEVTRQVEFERLQRRYDSINNEDAIELSGGR
ncbi:unnamed protein product [Arabidopsis halleri]